MLTCTPFSWQDFSDLEQDLDETTAEDSRQGKDMQVKQMCCVRRVLLGEPVWLQQFFVCAVTGNSLGQDAVLP